MEIESINITDTFRDGVDDAFWEKIEKVLSDSGWELTVLPETYGFRIDNNWISTCEVKGLRDFPEFHKTFDHVTDHMSQAGIVDLLASYFEDKHPTVALTNEYLKITDRLSDSYTRQKYEDDIANGIRPEVAKVNPELIKADAHLACYCACTSFSGPAVQFNRIRKEGLETEQKQYREEVEAYKEAHKHKSILDIFK